MKKTLVSIALIGASLTMAQVGINTEEPKATLDVVASPGDISLIDGFIAPRLTGEEMKTKDALYTNATGQTGTIVYATSASSDAGVTGKKTINVDGAGYYYFDGTVWVKFGSGDAAPGTEPWYVQNSTTQATANNQNIYQNGNVGLGDFSSSNPIARLDVRGTVRGGTPHADEISGASAIGANSIALGDQNKVSGTNAIAIGNINNVTGAGRAFGINNTVVNGTALGNGNTAPGGFAFGSANQTVTNAFAMGQNGKTTALGQVFVGFANTAYPAPLTSATNETRYVNQKHLFLDQLGVNTALMLGIGTLSPTNEVHIVPPTGADPVRIEGLQAGTAGDKIVVANATGVLKTIDASAIASATEPWNVQNTSTQATANTENIYQQGKVAIGFSSTDAVTGKQFEVKGDAKMTSSVTGGTTNTIDTKGGLYGNGMTMNSQNTNGLASIDVWSQPNDGLILLRGQSSTEQTSVHVEAGRLNLHNKSNGYGETNIEIQPALTVPMFGKGVTFTYRDDSNNLIGRYTFPTENGTANQVLTSPGPGNQLFWSNVAPAVSNDLSGTGNAYACINPAGQIYRSATPCTP